MASSLEKSVRVIKIVAKLFGYVKLKSSDLAEEFGVSIKTIQRDLKLIAEVLPLKTNRGLWWLDRSNIKEQKLAYELIKSFSQNAGIDIECLQDSKESLSLISFAIAYGSIDENIAKKIIDSINNRVSCQFFYTNNRGEKSQKVVSPISWSRSLAINCPGKCVRGSVGWCRRKQTRPVTNCLRAS